MSERALHCWKDKGEWLEERFGFQSDEHLLTYRDDFVGATCMLEAGHAGEHEWTADHAIGVRFEPAPPRFKNRWRIARDGLSFPFELGCEFLHRNEYPSAVAASTYAYGDLLMMFAERGVKFGGEADFRAWFDYLGPSPIETEAKP